MNTEIGYRLNGTFYLKGDNGNIVGFDVSFPSIYNTKEDAEQYNGVLGLSLEREEGRIVLRLYEAQEVVETLEWEKWWTYKCYKVKQECRGKESFTDDDFEPYYEKFETIFNYFVKSTMVKTYPLEYVQYWIEPVECEGTADLAKDLKANEFNQKKSLEEEFLTLTEDEKNMKFRGFLCEEVVKIDDLENVLNFDKAKYFKGKRFLTAKFETEVLNYENLKFKKVGFERFWRYSNGDYFKRVIGETGIHIGYQFKYVRFNIVENVKKDDFYI